MSFHNSFLNALFIKKNFSILAAKKKVYKNKNNQNIIAKKATVCEVITKYKCIISYAKYIIKLGIQINK